jgi:hypothetical protein
LKWRQSRNFGSGGFASLGVCSAGRFHAVAVVELANRNARQRAHNSVDSARLEAFRRQRTLDTADVLRSRSRKPAMWSRPIAVALSAWDAAGSVDSAIIAGAVSTARIHFFTTHVLQDCGSQYPESKASTCRLRHGPLAIFHLSRR